MSIWNVEYKVSHTQQYKQIVKAETGKVKQINKKMYKHPYMNKHKRFLTEFYKENKLAILMYLHLMKFVKKKKRRKKR